MRGDSGYAYLPAGQAEVEFGKYETRIRQLEYMNSTLAAEIDKMAPVVEAAINAVDNNRAVPLSVIDAVYEYKIAKKTATKA